MADDILLNQNIQMLTQALTALNQNMFNHTGGRSSTWGANTQVPGTSSVRGGVGDDKNTIKAIATNTLLEKTIRGNTDVVKYLIKNQTQNMKDLGKYTAVAGKYFADSVKDLSFKQLDVEIPKKLTESLNKTLGAGVVPKLKSYEDVVRVLTRAQVTNVDAALRLGKAFYDATGNITKQNKILNQLEKTGYDLDDYGKAVRDDGKALREHSGQLSAALADMATRHNSSEALYSKLGAALKVVGAAALAFGEEYLKGAVAAMKYGTEVTVRTFDQASRAGMSVEELIKTQNENIQAIHSTGMTFGQFNEMLDAGAKKMFAFTGSLPEGAKLSASIFDTFRTISNQGKSAQAAFVEQQQKAFAHMNRTIGTTAEQFTQLNTELLNNTNVQAQMYRLSAAQRVALHQGLLLQYEKLKSDGLSEEQTKRLIDQQAKLTGGKLTDRFANAAKVQGIFGALGLGAQGNRLGEIIRLGNRGTPEEIKARQAEATEIRKLAERQVSQQYGNASYAGEAMLDALTGVIPDIIGKESASAGLATSQGKEIPPDQAKIIANTDAMPELNETAKTIVKDTLMVGQAVTAAGHDIVGKLDTVIETIVGVGAAQALLRGGKGLLGRLGGLFGGAAEGEAAAAGIGGAGLATAAAGVAAAGAAGYGAGTLIDKIPRLFGGHDFSEMIADKLSPDYQQSPEITKRLEEINAQLRKNHDLQMKHLEETKKQTNVITQGNQQQAAQTDDHIEVTKKIVGEKDSRRAPRIQ